METADVKTVGGRKVFGGRLICRRVGLVLLPGLVVLADEGRGRADCRVKEEKAEEGEGVRREAAEVEAEE